MLRRSLPFALVAALVILFILSVFRNASWNSIPQSFGLGESYGPSAAQIASGANIAPDLRLSDPAGRKGGSHFKEPKVDSESPYPVGKVKEVGSNYTRTLVIPKTGTEDTEWIRTELGDMMDEGLLDSAIYHTTAWQEGELHVPENKGHEVMVYLSYIIDFYDKLPDVSIFMHSHRWAWHNNEILNTDASLMVRHLSPERVTREGYMNLRCHWDPGCPDWIHPGMAERIYEKQEEHLIADSWAELFPLDQIPRVLAQPCCAQFAVSRDRILAIPRATFEQLRDWVLRTDLSDYLSGRVFEYTWQYIFTSSPQHCPSMSVCYCDGYGYCFGSPEKFDYYFELRFNLNDHEEELRLWNEKATRIEEARMEAKDGRMNGEEALEVPETGKDAWLKEQIQSIKEEMQSRKEAAFRLGRDARQRAKEAGRGWKEGDGF